MKHVVVFSVAPTQAGTTKRFSCLTRKAQFTKVSGKEIWISTIIIFYRNINKSSSLRATFAITYEMLDFP